MLTETLPLHERVHNEDFDFGGPADCDYVDAFDNRDEYYPYGKCTCGYQAMCHGADEGNYEAVRFEDWENICSGCDPFEFDNCPYGFGLELWEYGPRLAERARVRGQWRGGPYRRLDVPYEEIDAAGEKATPELARRLARAARGKWDRIGSKEGITNRQAREEYTKWAKMVVSKRS